jgi:hypothetical protein
MSPRRFVALLSIAGILVLLLAIAGAWALSDWQHDWVAAAMWTSGAVYAAAAWLVWRHAGELPAAVQRRALLGILAVALLARLALIGLPPVSTDVYRYVWDGRVQAAGINPYRFAPAARELEFLRDRDVYPWINRAATAVTIYPPFAQMIFLGVTRVTDSVTGIKAAMVGFETLTVAGLLALLRRRGRPASHIIFYAWHPLPLFEFAGSGHIDAAALALAVLACLAAEVRRPFAAGALLAGAALVKYFPVVIAPALYRRWGWRLPVALIAVGALLYLPYLGVGARVLGFLPGYLREEGLTNGSGFFALSALSALIPLPRWADAAYVVLGGLALAALGLRVVMRAHPDSVSPEGALVLLAAFTLWVSPHLPWYFTWTIPFLCFCPSWALIYLSVAAPLLYDNVWSPGALPLQAALYGPFAVLLGLDLWRRHRLEPISHPAPGALNDG